LSLELTIGHLLAAGSALFSAGQADLGLDFFQYAASVAPEDPAVLADLATALLALERYEDAETTIARSIAICSSAHRLVIKGRVMLATDRVGNAVWVFRHAVMLEPDSGEALGWLGVGLVNLWPLRHDEVIRLEAIPLLNRAIELMPDVDEFMSALSEATDIRG